MWRRNRALPSEPPGLPAPDRSALLGFYRTCSQWVEQQLALELESDLQSAIGLVSALEQDDWAW